MLVVTISRRGRMNPQERFCHTPACWAYGRDERTVARYQAAARA